MIEGTLVQRVNRFLALIEVGGSVERAFVANTGRLAELMLPGARVFSTPVSRPPGHTQLDLKLVESGGYLVSIDTRTPIILLQRALQSGSLAEFRGHAATRREVTHGACRFDFALDGPAGPCLIEAKSVTLVENGRGLFPDAPTERGTRHVNTLAGAIQEGYRAAVIFILQRQDAAVFSPHDEMDQEFGQALRQAVAAGVEAYAYRCKVDLAGIEIEAMIPIDLWHSGPVLDAGVHDRT